MTSENIQLLAQKASGGNLDAFTEIVGYFEKILLKFIIRISDVSVMEAEEILQETFIHAWKYINEFDNSFAFSSWIYRIARQKTISYHRKEVSRGKEKKVVWDDEYMGNIASSFDLEKEFLTKEIQKKVQQAIDYLPKNQKEIIILKYIEQKSYNEISDILHIPVGTAGSLASRAKKQLSRSLYLLK